MTLFDKWRHTVHVCAGQREVPAVVIRLNLRVPAIPSRAVLDPAPPASPPAGEAPSDDDLNPRPRRRDFGAGAQKFENLGRPWRDAATRNVTATVHANARVRVVVSEHEPNALRPASTVPRQRALE
jgi:hypothetical protein